MPLPGENAMNFSKLPKEKRNRLVLVALLALIVMAGLYFGLIQSQTGSLERLAQKKDAAAQKLKGVGDAIRQTDRIKAELDEVRATLASTESDIASGDLYAWVINSLRQFKAPYRVDIPQYSQLSTPVDVNLLPGFPYKQATLTVAGTARFHELGQFLADFENRFPHVRLVNLTLDANSPSAAAEPETLSFKLDIVTLVKSNAS
jgi:Tfp pilus assembly protein PilO